MKGPNYKDGSTLPKDSRTLPVPANRDRDDGTDFRNLYTCWNCGFPCKVGRDELGGIDSLAGTSHLDYSTPSDYYESNQIVVGGPTDSFLVLLELDAAGDPKEITHDFQSVISGGCSQCGCKNWRGDY
jgi:hypothetical protein